MRQFPAWKSVLCSGSSPPIERIVNPALGLLSVALNRDSIVKRKQAMFEDTEGVMWYYCTFKYHRRPLTYSRVQVSSAQTPGHMYKGIRNRGVPRKVLFPVYDVLLVWLPDIYIYIYIHILVGDLAIQFICVFADWHSCPNDSHLGHGSVTLQIYTPNSWISQISTPHQTRQITQWESHYNMVCYINILDITLQR